MEHIKPDIAILPIDGKGTMTVDDAVEVVKQMRPRWAIPSNWGLSSEGATRLDAQAFKSRLEDQTEAVILPQIL
jgi:L-ascorbate metabolism protein UlaG (beta-lactamase superfamily)